jgi:hypothetical protein
MLTVDDHIVWHSPIGKSGVDLHQNKGREQAKIYTPPYQRASLRVTVTMITERIKHKTPQEADSSFTPLQPMILIQPKSQIYISEADFEAPNKDYRIQSSN